RRRASPPPRRHRRGDQAHHRKRADQAADWLMEARVDRGPPGGDGGLPPPASPASRTMPCCRRCWSAMCNVSSVSRIHFTALHPPPCNECAPLQRKRFRPRKALLWLGLFRFKLAHASLPRFGRGDEKRES